MIAVVDEQSFIRLTTDDAGLILPALAQLGASFRLSGASRIDVRGMSEAEVARVAALSNARVADLQILRTG